MYELFPAHPEGFYYYSEFINPDEEQYLLRCVDKEHLSPFVFQGFEAKRKTASFGYDYHFSTRKLEPANAIPAEFHPLVKKVELITARSLRYSITLRTLKAL